MNDQEFRSKDLTPSTAPAKPLEQPKIDFATLQAKIIESDDGSEAMTRSRHNMLDPSPDEIMGFVVEYMDSTDARLKNIEDKINEMLQAHYTGKMEKVREIE